VSAVENEIVALAVSPGFSDAEAQAGGFGEKGGLGGFPVAFASGETDGIEVE